MNSDQSTRDSRDRGRFTGVANPASDQHVNGEYFTKNPTWHVEYSPWKADNIDRLIKRRQLEPQTICEVGCGAGEVLRQLQLKMDPNALFSGYDIAPPAIEMAKKGKTSAFIADFGEVETAAFDLLLILEVVDHVEDYLGFLRMLKQRAEWKIFSFSLDISVQSAFRRGAFTQRIRRISRSAVLRNWRNRLGQRSFFKLDPDFAVRLFGSYSLLILAR